MLKNSKPLQFDIAVVGGGAAGFAAALMLADGGRSVALVTGGRPAPADGRCIALMQPALDRLGRHGVTFETTGTPLAAIRVFDATGALLRAPTVTFRAAELGLPRFGLAIPAPTIVEALRARAEAAGIRIFEEAASNILPGIDGVSLLAGTVPITARLLVGADGARSSVREAAGIPCRTWRYPQEALTFVVRHELDHEDVSNEFHTREGPFTLVPNGDRESSVVWLVHPVHARRLATLDDAAFALAAERQCDSLLGRFNLVGSRGRHPMRGLLAPEPAATRTALVGEAAHVFPPIGAQGLNLGLRDVGALADSLTAGGDDPGSPAVLTAYAGRRRSELTGRTAAVDLLNRSLLSGFLPVQAMRGAALALLGTVPPLRRAVMRLGLG